MPRLLQDITTANSNRESGERGYRRFKQSVILSLWRLNNRLLFPVIYPYYGLLTLALQASASGREAVSYEGEVSGNRLRES
jgi:hypothetical protein